ncbi:MAG TPA: hypothetical protein DF699_04390 [Phycisphaerales bacterium]|nr:hypothetical protein [Phycisphaerales bacterium]
MEMAMAKSYQDIKIADEQSLTNPQEYLADIPARLVSGVLGLMGFVTACVVGLLAGNPGGVVLSRALLAMLICVFVGRLLGIIGEMCVREYVERYKSERPRPNKPQQLVDLDRANHEHQEVVDRFKKAA